MIKSSYYEINDAKLKKEFGLVRQLEAQHKNLQRKVKAKDERRFSAHPKRILSDSETTTASNSPRARDFEFRGSNPDLNLEKASVVYQDRKLKAHNLRRKLHEKLSLVAPNNAANVENCIGDSHGNIHRSRFSVDLEIINPPTESTKHQNKTKDSETKRFTSPSFSSRGLSTLAFEKKFKTICEKSLQALTDIKSTIAKGIPPPDGEEDLARRTIRLREFANRFSRNYLYPLDRQLKTLDSQNQQNPKAVDLRQILTPFQTALHALQAYQSHLPTSTGNCSIDQLKILLADVVRVCEVHRQHIEDEDSYILEFIDTLKINAELVTRKAEEFLTAPRVPRVAEEAKKEIEKREKPARRTKTADGRFAMYATTASFRRDALWKRTTESMSKRKFNVKSKYKTATFKHRPPISKEPEAVSVPKLSLSAVKKSGVMKNSPVNCVPTNEDEIKTLVEVSRGLGSQEKMELDDGGTKEVDKANKEELMVRLLRWTLQNHNKNATGGENRNLAAEMLDMARSTGNVEPLRGFLGELKHKNEKESQRLSFEIVKSRTESDINPKKKAPKITVTGPKNARLICITDENSIVDESEQKLADEKPRQTDGEEVVRTSSETQTDVVADEHVILAKDMQKGRKVSVKISRVKKTERELKPLEKKYAISAIQYKLDFYRHCKNNPMYRRTSNCQPCSLMSKISEDILNHSLLEVAREIEVNDIAEKVYKAELQL